MSVAESSQRMGASFEGEATRVAEVLRSSRLVVMYGDAGAGKTRLLRRWLIPSLAGDRAQQVVYFDAWDEAPLDALNAAIERSVPPDVAVQGDTPLLRFGPWVERLFAWTREPGQSLVLVLDHFERYLAAPDGEGIGTFARQWAAALAAPRLRVHFLVAMRTEAEAAMTQRFERRVASLGQNRIVLPRLEGANAAPSNDETTRSTAPSRTRPDRAPVATGIAAGAPPSVAMHADARDEIAVHGQDNMQPGRSVPESPPLQRAARVRAARPAERPRPERVQPDRARPERASPSLDDLAARERAFYEFDVDVAGGSALEDGGRRRGPHWLTILAGIAAAVVFFAIFFAPGPNDLRVPRRAQLNAATRTGAAIGAPTAPPAAVAQTGPSIPAPAQAQAAAPPLPTAAPTQALPAVPTVDAKADSARVGVGLVTQAPAAAPVVTPAPAERGNTANSTTGRTGAGAAAAVANDIDRLLAPDDGLRAPAVNDAIGKAAAAGAVASAPELAVARYDVLDSLRWENEANSRYAETLRVLVPLQVDPIYVAVRRDDPIAFVNQIAGRKINLGAAGTDAALGIAHLYQKLFETSVGARNASYLSDADALRALVQQHSVDVVVLTGRAGLDSLLAQQRATPGAFKLLAFDGSSASGQRALRSYVSIVVPPVDRSGFLTRDLATLGVMSFLVSRGMGEDATGRVVRALCEHLPRLRAAGLLYLHDASPVPVRAAGLRYTTSAERELRACDARSFAAREQGGPNTGSSPTISRLANSGERTR